MGRGKSYKIEDYADRIVSFLSMKGGEATTEELIKEVTGTDFRLADGLFYLAMRHRVKASVSEHIITWTLKDN